MRLEIGERVGQCKLYVTGAERAALVDAHAQGQPPDLPEEVREHLRAHGHYANVGMPGLSFLLGLQVFVED